MLAAKSREQAASSPDLPKDSEIVGACDQNESNKSS
jgi:hypothetical protein